MAKPLRINEALIRKAETLEPRLAKQLRASFRLRLSIEDVLRLMANIKLVDSLKLPEPSDTVLREAFVSGAEIVGKEL